jgi:hypothetical protein
MRTPRGANRSWRLALSGGLGYRGFEPMSHDALGTYRFTARRGRLHAEGSVVVTISAQTFMRLRAYDGRTQIVVGGLPAHQTVAVRLYRAWGRRAVRDLRRDYYASLNVATDAQGTGVVEIVPGHGTTYTCYVAALENAPDQFENQQFCFGLP